MKNWIKLFLYLLAVWGFVFLTPLVLNKISAYSAIIQKSESLEIDNSALFYSEEPLTSSAEMELRERLNARQK